MGGMTQRRELFTAVTTNICGDIDPTTLGFTQAERDAAKSTTDKVNSMMGGNPLKDFVTQGTEFTGENIMEYAQKLIVAIAPYLVFFLISLIGCCCYLYNWCCNYCSCCKNACTGCCKCCKAPTSTKRRTLYFVVAIVLCLGIFSASIAGIATAKNLSFDKFTCSIVGFLDTIVNGDSSLKWIGVKPAVSTLSSLGAQIGTVVSDLGSQSIDAQTTDMDNSLNAAITKIDDLYTDYNTRTLPRADPTQTPTTYTPEFIDKLGDSSTDGTVCYALRTEMEVKKTTLATLATQMNDNLGDIDAQAGNFQSAIDSATNLATDMSKSMSDALDSLSSTGEQINSGGNGANSGVTAIFGVTLAFSLIAIISMVLVKFCNIKLFNKCAHVSWCFLGLFTILGFLLASILYPVSIVSVGLCDVFNSLLNDRTVLQNTFKTFSLDGSIGDTIDTCFYAEKKSILEKFGITDKIGLLNETLSYLDQVNQFVPGSNVPDSLVIPVQQFLVTQLTEGTMVDSSNTLDDLTALNAYTTSPSGCSIRDTWLLNSANCTTSQGTKLTATDGATTNSGSATCIGMYDAWLPRATYSADTSARYSAPLASCNGPTVITFVNSFINNRDQAKTLFTEIQGRLTDISDANADFMTKVRSFTDRFTNVNTTINTISSQLLDPNTGILSNAECGFIRTSLNRVYDALCVGIITTLYQTSVVLIVLSFFSLFGTFFIFCVAKRALIQNDEDKQ